MGQRSLRVAIVSVLRLVSLQAQGTAGNQCIVRTARGQSSPHRTCQQNFPNYPFFPSCTGRTQHTIRHTMSSKCHVKARSRIYPRTEKLPEPVERTPVADNQVPWNSDYPGYDRKVKEFTSPGVLKGPVWADDPDPKKIQLFNQLDKKVDRKSFVGTYDIVDGYPRNPMGRTGLHGRGCLGRWGPNHAGDPIVTRWKRDENHKKVCHKTTGKPILQFVSVQRSDNKEWALPGGMVDPGESRTQTIKREFGEEALSSLDATESEKKAIEQTLHDFFKEESAVEIYEGYVDDPRNTDNAWMETKAYNFHDEEGTGVALFQLKAGDDAMNVQWMDVDSNLNLYASHEDFIQKTANLRNAHW